jgi:hypothetical protein
MEDLDGEIFEPSEGLSFLEESSERFGGDTQCYFFLFRSLGALPAFIAPLEIRSAEGGGCVVTCYGRHCLFEVHLRERGGDSFATLTMQAISDKGGERQERSSWRASEPSSWLAIVRTILRSEGVTAFLPDFPARLENEWAQYQEARRGRLGF